MLKRLTDTVCVVLFACWLTGFGMSVWHSSKYPKGTQQNRATHIAEQKSQKDVTDERLADYTLLLAWFTAVLAVSTIGLWIVTWRSGLRQSGDMQASIEVARQAAEAAQTQAAILAAVEGPMPLIAQLKLAQYASIPGDSLVADPVPAGPVPANCRILVAVENKGRTTLRIVELCIEKFVGSDLPGIPRYSHSTSFNFYLEKGPIWLRGSDEQIVVTPADIGAMHAYYPSHGAFWVYGYFAYPDLLNRRVEHKFCVRWDQTAGFVPDNRPDYT
jgi:hypothetical protein